MANGRISLPNPLLEIRVRSFAFRDSQMRACQLGAIFFRRIASPAASTIGIIAVSLCLHWQYSVGRKGCFGGEAMAAMLIWGFIAGFGIIGPLGQLGPVASPNTKQMPASMDVYLLPR